ncbi:alpha-soluble NSF attachment protein 2 isoform X2 [Physcomitrium patens]|uniref:Alpha-soluble NSF attachment protein n=1 Tax=Physcomitrium patens TaxID=3218 RepID=A0A7I4CC92_PHYPA|nr:alpha-soluble NSF attachment protein 2-like isoform X2 [Physcomitrium patens]|eukprot:XP_024360193.1 alpha-soluble NSF attachment protein 2-like isoform X2 [Physcomitrella patens]
MGDHKAKGMEYEKTAENKLNTWAFFGSKYEDAADLLEKAGNSYKLSKSWDEAASAYIKLASCQLKMDSKHEAAAAYVDAANAYKKKPDSQQAVKMLAMATQMFEDIGRLSMAAKHYKDIADIYEKEEDFGKAMEYYDKAADLYSGENIESTSNQCKLKVAQYAAQTKQYERATQIYQTVAKNSMNNNLLKYSVKGYLLNAGLCQICGKDIVAVQNAIESYQELDPTFSGTRECKFLQDLAASIDEMDVEKFTEVVKEFDSMIRLCH